MALGDFILSLITLILVLLFMFNPLFRKLLKSFQGKEEEAERGEDSMYESTDSRRVVTNLTETMDSPEGKKIVYSTPALRSGPREKTITGRRKQHPAMELRKANLKQAVLLKEILDAPRALRPYGEDELF